VFGQGESSWVVIVMMVTFMLVLSTFVSHSSAAIIAFPIIIEVAVQVGHVRHIAIGCALICSGYVACCV
jgi:di/tricarboxylate transporter